MYQVIHTVKIIHIHRLVLLYGFCFIFWQKEGVEVWIDVERMGGSTLSAMAEAVENAAVVLICMSEKYKQSPNCRLGEWRHIWGLFANLRCRIYLEITKNYLDKRIESPDHKLDNEWELCRRFDVKKNFIIFFLIEACLRL